MIVFDPSQCTGCGTCLAVRGRYCLSRDGAGIRVDRLVCNECGECVARCPSQAFSFEGHRTERLDYAGRAAPAAVEELLVGRRSTRHFTDEPVDRETLLSLARMARHAPSMNHDIEVVVVDDRELLREMDGKLSAQFCLSNMILYAESLGLATCLMDSVKIGVNAMGSLRGLLGIPRGHAVAGAVHVGHPRYRTLNTTPSLSLPVRFVSPPTPRDAAGARAFR